jgi:hypothetical protein
MNMGFSLDLIILASPETATDDDHGTPSEFSQLRGK